MIKEIVRHSVIVAGDRKRLRFCIQTNGSRLNDEIVEFLDANEFSVGISLDGNTDEANSQRKSFGAEPNAWRYLETHFCRYIDFLRRRCGILAVVSRSSSSELPGFALWLQDLGIKGFSFTFLDLVGRGTNLSNEKLTPAEAVALYAAFVELIEGGLIRDLAVNPILSRLRNLYTFVPEDLCHKGPCGAYQEFLVLDATGEFRSCDCVYEDFFALGHIVDCANSDNARRQSLRIRQEWLRSHHRGCSQCSLFGLCGGTCVAKAIASTGTPYSVDPLECAVSKYIYPKVLKDFALCGDSQLLAYYRHHYRV